jgi:hypothetical protein
MSVPIFRMINTTVFARLAGNVELFGKTLLHKTHWVSRAVSSPVCVNPGDKYEALYFLEF